MSKNSVFISYRRGAAGDRFARLIQQTLKHRGYDVFLDVESLDAGKWAEKILPEVAERSHFLLLLTPGAMDRCANRQDWMRREFESALEHERNIVPLCDESLDLPELKRSCPDCMKRVFDFQYVTVPHVNFDQAIDRLLERFVAPHKAPATSVRVPKRLEEIAKSLHVSGEVFENFARVVSHPQFPAWMAVSNELLRNPVWEGVSAERKEELLNAHRLDGPSPPAVIHLDMLLIRRDNSRGRGELFTYFSPTWKTNLVLFRQWLPEDDPGRRAELNAENLAKYGYGTLDSIRVTPLPGKFAISAKLNAEYGELTLYVFEFCSVVFTEPLNENSKLLASTSDTAGTRWFDLDSLKADETASALNGDLIRSLHRLFSISLGPLPVSFSRSV